jgi:hypothetical protein
LPKSVSGTLVLKCAILVAAGAAIVSQLLP